MRRSAFVFLLVLFCGLARAATNGEGYIGCYTDAADRDFGLLVKGGDSTPSICRDLCSKANYDYFGLQAGGQCFCDDNYGRYQKASNCNDLCSADSNFFCGGAWANSIYSVNTDLNHVKLGSRIDGLTHEQLHAGLALMRDLIPAGFDAQTIVGHIKNGTVPSFTTSQVQAVKRSQLPPTGLARRDLDLCTKDFLSVGWDAISILIGLMGIKARVGGDLNSLGMTASQVGRFEGITKVLAESTSTFERAKAAVSLISGILKVAGLKAIVHLVTAHMTWWDYVKTAVSLVAQAAIWLGSDGLALIGELALETENVIDLGLDCITLNHDCGYDQPTPTSLPPTSVQIAVMEHLNGTKSDVELFILDAQGSIQHRWERPDLSWTGWQQLPHSQTFSRLAAGRDQGGFLEVCGIASDGALWKKYQNPSAGGAWTPWQNFGGWSSEITLSSNADGRLEMVAAGSSNRAFHRWQTAPNGGWAAWDTLSSSTSVKAFSTFLRPDGSLQVFALGTDGALYYARAGGNLNGWTSWQSLGGWSSSIVSSRNADGRLEVFAVGSDNNLFHIWENTPNSNSWSSWAAFFTFKARQLTATKLADGNIIVFALGMDQAISYNYEAANGWSGWTNLGGSASTISSLTTKDGIVQVYALFSGDKNIHVAQQLKATEPSKWTNWTPLN